MPLLAALMPRNPSFRCQATFSPPYKLGLALYILDKDVLLIPQQCSSQVSCSFMLVSTQNVEGCMFLRY